MISKKKRSSLKLQGIFQPKSQIQAVFLSSSQKRHKIWCLSTNNTNLDLDLRSRSPRPVNFFGAQSSLRRAQFSFGGAQAVSCVAPGLGGTHPLRSFSPVIARAQHVCLLVLFRLMSEFCASFHELTNASPKLLF